VSIYSIIQDFSSHLHGSSQFENVLCQFYPQYVITICFPEINFPSYMLLCRSSPPSAEIKNAWICTSITPYVFMVWCLFKHRDIFWTFLVSSSH